MQHRDRHLRALGQDIPAVEPVHARAAQSDGAVLIDIREPEERAEGTPAGAVAVARGYLELRIEQHAPDPSQPVMIICGSGARSLLAADALRRMGYRRVSNVAGGFNRWREQGLPVEVPEVPVDPQRQRYLRQMALPEIGEAGQRRLAASRVLLVGAGGLGSPAALYLAAAGIGTLGVVDDDRVERSNLHRQVLHPESRVGMSKVASAHATVAAINTGVRFVGHEERLNADNAPRLIDHYDLVIDGSDNFATRYALNDACVAAGVPLVHGSVYRFEGQVAAFWPARSGPCYRCVFPEPPPTELAPSCAQAGVLGVLPGVIGLFQATESIKLLLELGRPLLGRMLAYDALRSEVRTLQIASRPECRCQQAAAVSGSLGRHSRGTGTEGRS